MTDDDYIKQYYKILSDTSLETYDPHQIALEKGARILFHRKKRRAYYKLFRDKEDRERRKFLDFRFQSNEKLSVEDAKAKARLHEDVQAFNDQLDQAEKEKDLAYAKLEVIIEKIGQMADRNATARAEMKMGSLIT